MLGRELDAAMELIGEVFSVGADEVKRMVKERMESRGMIKGSKREKECLVADEKAVSERGDASAKKPLRQSRKRKKIKESPD
jgi:CBS-domain-containing membrane protein